MSADIEARGHMGNCPGYALLTSQGEATEFRERVARRESCKESERRQELELSEVQGDVLEDPGDKYDDKVAVRHADASGGHIKENQHEKNRKRDIQVNDRGPGAAREEQMDEGRKMARFEQEALNTSAFSDPYVALEHLVRDETPRRPGSVLVQKSFEHISALDVFYEKDERENRGIGDVLGQYRGKDAGDLKRSELDVLIESWTCLNAPARNIF